MSRKPVAQFINEYLRDFQDTDLSIFEIYDETTKEKYLKCIASNETKCTEKFPSTLTRSNVTLMFKHLHQEHSVIYEWITNDFTRWYSLQLQQKSSSSSDSVGDILTANEFEQLFEQPTTATNTTTLNNIYSDLYLSFEPSSNCENSSETPAATVDLQVFVRVHPI